MDDDSPRPGGAVFIDVPNIRTGEDGSRIINWSSLAQEIAPHFQDTTLVYAGAYVTTRQKWHNMGGWISRMQQTLKGCGYETAMRYGSDIDSWIINDMWKSIFRYQQHLIAEEGKLSFPLRMRYVLISGDRGYLRFFDSINEELTREGVELELIVYSWRDSLSEALTRYAHEIYYLDDIADILVFPLGV